MSRLRRLIAIVALLAVVCGPQGCSMYRFMGPSEEVRAQFGTIGVLAYPFDPDTAMQNLPAGVLAEAWRGAGTGLLKVGSIADGAPSTPAEAGAVYLAIMLVLIPPAIIAGTVDGVMNAESQQTIDRARTVLRHQLARLNFKMRETLIDHFLREARARTNYDLVVYEQNRTVYAGNATRANTPMRAGVDSVLELTLESVDLVGGVIHHPNFALAISCRVKVTAVTDGAVLYEATFPYEMYGDHSLEEWVANDGEILAEEWHRGINTIARDIVNELLVYYPLS